MVFSENIYLLGAGFTKAVHSRIPLNYDLLETIIAAGAEKLSIYQKKYKTDDIERLLTQIDLDGFADKQARQDRHAIELEISVFFSKYRFSVLNNNIPSWLKTFSEDLLKENDSIISLNYDCILEGVLDYLGVWTPRDSYAHISDFPTDSILPNPKKKLFTKFMVQKISLNPQLAVRIKNKREFASKLTNQYTLSLVPIHILVEA